MSDDVVRRYNGARPIPAPAQLLADAIREVEVLREENARLLAANKDLQLHFDVVKEDLKKADEENARLLEALEPIVKIKAFTCIYEWTPVEALRDDEEVRVKLTGAQIKKMREAAIREGGND